MISYYKGKFLDSKKIDLNEKLFRGIGIELFAFLTCTLLKLYALLDLEHHRVYFLVS